MQRKTQSKILCSLLATCMLFSSIPTMVFADDGSNDAIPAETSVLDASTEESTTTETEAVVEETDENVESIPTNDSEPTTDVTEDIEEPPIEETNVTTDETSSETTVDETEPTDETTVETTVTDETTEETETTETTEEAEPVYEYSVTLPDDTSIYEGESVSVAANVVATATTVENEEEITENVDYTFEFLVDDAFFTDSTTMTYTFSNAGTYTITGNLIVDGEVVASDSMNVNVNPGFVEFDHYFTEIDESLVQTTELFVQTSNSSVFTRNTNVISRFDDVYIISFDDVQTARYAYSYYVDKVDNITDLSQVMSIATDENSDDVADMSNVNNGGDAIANLNDISVQDYSGYIALIDTGAPEADAQFSVIGDDLTDYNGHGTAMYNYILEENPNAQVMSIKVFDGSNANAADVYAGIRLAIDSNVSVINLSFVGANLERNAIVKDIIQEAIDKGIVVIGAAGNYNLDATQFIPGCIEGVITVGAANADGTKYGSSNFNADLYVIATSTSEATARYTGIYTAGIESDKVFYNLDQPIEYDDNFDPEMLATTITESLKAAYGYGQAVVIYNGDGSWSIAYDFSDAPYEDDFYIAATQSMSIRDLDNITDKPFFDSGWSGTETGTCDFYNPSSGDLGEGTVTLTGHGNVSASSGSPVYLSDYVTSFTAVCSRHYGEEDSHHAPWLRGNQTVYYRATYTTHRSEDNSKTYIDWTVDVSNRSDFSQPTWSSESKTIHWSITAQGTGSSAIFTAYVDGERVYSFNTPTQETVTETIAHITHRINDIADAARDEYGGVKNNGWTSGSSWPTIRAIAQSGSATYKWDATNEQQVFRAKISGWRWNYVYLDLNKTGFDLCSFTAGNPNYSLQGVTFEVLYGADVVGTIEVTSDDHNGNLTYRFTSNPYGTEIVSDDKLSLSHELAGKSVRIRETHGGINYSWTLNNTTTVALGQPGTTTVANIQNVPQGDPVRLTLTKNSNINGGTNYNGNIDPEGAIYTVEYYYSNGGSLARTMTYVTDSNGYISFYNASQCTSGNYFTDNNGHISWPVGYYKIYETQVPTTSSIERGLQLSSRYWTIDVWTGIDNNTPGDTIYRNIVQHNPDGTTETLFNGPAAQDNTTLTDAVDSIDVEPEIWLPIGLVKVDTERYAHGQEYSRPQGDAALGGATFQLLTNDTTIFDYLPNHTYGGHTYYVGSAVTGGYYQVLVDGVPVEVTTADDGYAHTSVSFPYATHYAWREIVAPEGYILDQSIYQVSSVWTTNNGSTVVPLDHNVANGGVYVDEAHAIVGNRRNGFIPDTPYRGQIRIVKHDYDLDSVGVTNSNANSYGNGIAQGDASLAGVRYAIVNRSERSIFYTPTGTEYEPNQVVVILTTNEYGKCQTPANALPYGTYDVYELRQDATIQPGEIYDGSSKLGTSIYANDSYLFSEGYARSVVRTTATTDVDVQNFTLRTNGQVVSGLFGNEVISGTLEIWKYNTETETNLNQGNNQLNIEFAVVNRSAKAIELHDNDGKSLGVYQPGQIIAILTTSGNGHVVLENIPYGTYDVYELRRDNTLAVGDYYDRSASKYGSADYANAMYLYDESIGDPYSVTAPQRFVVRRQQATTYTQVWTDVPLRGDFEVKKYNEDGYPMANIPFLVQLLQTDENGKVATDENGEYIVIEEHVVLTDATGHFNSATTRNNLNSLDQYYDGQGNYTGPLDSSAACGIWFGVGGPYGSERYNNNAWGEYPHQNNVTVDGRGSLLYGQYRVEELNCANNTGMTMLERQFVIDADHQFYDATRIQIDMHSNMITVANDLNTDSSSLSYGTEVTVQDEVQLINIRYKDEDGNILTYKIHTDVMLHVPGETDTKIGENDYEFEAEQINPATNITTQTEVIEFKIDSTQCPEGSYIYFVNSFYEKIDSDWSTTPILIHNEDDSVESERLYVPTINTDAINNTTLTNIASIDPLTSATDEIEFIALPNKMLGDLTIQLVDDNGNVVQDVDGNDCTWSSFIYALDSAGPDDWQYVDKAYGRVLTGPTTGTITMDDLGIGPWIIPAQTPGSSVHFQIIVASTLSGETICYDNIHLDDPNEALRWLKIWSTAESEIGDQGMIPQDENAVVVENIYYQNLAEDTTVRVDGKIYDVTNGTDNAELVLEQSFYQDITVGTDRSGEFTVTFDPIDTSDKGNHRYVVVDNIYMEVNGEDVLIAEHNVMDDDLETLYVPDCSTTLFNSHEAEYKVVSETYADVTLIDHVAYTNVRPGTELQMTAVLMDVNTNQPVRDADGNIVTNTVQFVPTEESGVVDVPLTFTQVLVSRDWEADDAWVCFENMQPSRPGHEDFNYVVHNDIHDEDQTIYHPAFRTTAVNAHTGTQYIQSLPDQTVTDTVELRNFKQAVEEGDIFTLVIEAHDAETGEALLDADGNVVTASKTFVYNGQTSETIDLTFDATGLENTIVVFYETLYFGTHTSGDEHKVLEEVDKDNTAQSVIVLDVRTTATDDASANTDIISAQRIINDDIHFYGIAPDTDYVIATRLVDQATGDFITNADGSEYVVYTNYHSPAHSDNVADDLIDANGNVVGVTTHTIIKMDINDTNAIGKTVVVFERVFVDAGVTPVWTATKITDDVPTDDTPFASHEDIDDDFQTVHVPDIHTNAMDKNDGDQTLRAEDGVQTIVDTVTYTNLIPGDEYTVTGVLVLKSVFDDDGNPEYVLYNGKKVTGETTFTASATGNGTVDVEFTFDASPYAGRSAVVFETLMFEDIEVVVHADINDEDQTVVITGEQPEISTSVRDAADGDNVVAGGENQTIIDTVEYHNLVPDQEYTMTCELVVSTGHVVGEPYEYVVDKDGNIVTATISFTPTSTDGTVEVPLTFDASNYSAKQLVCFETCRWLGLQTVAEHKDINDFNQTFYVSSVFRVRIAKADANNISYMLSGAEITIFNEDGTIATDVNGNQCVGLTDANGMVEFVVVNDGTHTYYAQETKAPAGYNINPDKFAITPISEGASYDSDGALLIPITILDTIIVIPPKTGDNFNMGLWITLAVLAVLGVAGGTFYMTRNKKKNSIREANVDSSDVAGSSPDPDPNTPTEE